MGSFFLREVKASGAVERECERACYCVVFRLVEHPSQLGENDSLAAERPLDRLGRVATL